MDEDPAARPTAAEVLEVLLEAERLQARERQLSLSLGSSGRLPSLLLPGSASRSSKLPSNAALPSPSEGAAAAQSPDPGKLPLPPTPQRPSKLPCPPAAGRQASLPMPEHPQAPGPAHVAEPGALSL